MKNNWRAVVLALFGAWLLGVAIPSAAFDIESMPTPEMQKRYDGLTHELRCMQCQNQSIADSPVGLAEDLRRDVREQIIAGKTMRRFAIRWSRATATSSCFDRHSLPRPPGCGCFLSCCCSSACSSRCASCASAPRSWRAMTA